MHVNKMEGKSKISMRKPYVFFVILTSNLIQLNKPVSAKVSMYLLMGSVSSPETVPRVKSIGMINVIPAVK